VSGCCEKLVVEVEIVRESRGSRTSAVESRYRATASEDVNVDTRCACVRLCVCVRACVGGGRALYQRVQ
jgi:hypothetical protein